MGLGHHLDWCYVDKPRKKYIKELPSITLTQLLEADYSQRLKGMNAVVDKINEIARRVNKEKEFSRNSTKC